MHHLRFTHRKDEYLDGECLEHNFTIYIFHLYIMIGFTFYNTLYIKIVRY